MSRRQGDHFRTHTNHELNAYRARLDEKVNKLRAEEVKNFIVTNEIGEEFLIQCTQGNNLFNPNGSWKWDGWIVTHRYYRVWLYLPGNYDRDTFKITNPATEGYASDPDGDYKIVWTSPTNYEPGVRGFLTTDGDLYDRDKANRLFNELVNRAKTHTAEELKKAEELRRYGEPVEFFK